MAAYGYEPKDLRFFHETGIDPHDIPAPTPEIIESVNQLGQRKAVEIAFAVAEAIHALGSVPSGHLYAQLMSRMTLSAYNGVIAMLKQAGVISVAPDHLLTWTAKV